MAGLFDDVPMASGDGSNPGTGRLSITVRPRQDAGGDAPQAPLSLDPRARELAIRTVLGEAANQGDDGMAAVANVIRNRVDSGRYGDGPIGVITKKAAFEPWMTQEGRSRMFSYAPDSPPYQSAAAAIDSAFAQDANDPTGGATHFFAPRAQAALGRNPPSWAQGDPLAAAGGHLFYAPEGVVRRAGAAPMPPTDVSAQAQQPAPAAAPAGLFDDVPMASFDARFSGEGPAPAPTADLKAAMRERQDPRQRGRDIAKEEGGYMDAIPVAISTGMVGNLPDYPPALVSGVASAIRGDGFGKGYDASLEEQRGMREGLAEKYPGTTLAGVLGGALTTGIKSAGLVTSPTVVGRVAQSAGVGGALGAAQGWATGEGTEDRLRQGATGALYGAAFGAGGEAAVSGIGKGVQRYLGAVRQPAPGVVPAERIAAADEFGIPLTRGQASGSVDQQAFEEAARHGARGLPAGQAVRGFDAQQGEAIRAAREGISDSLGGPVATIPETGGAVAGAIKERASSLRNQADSLYTSAGAKDASIASDEVAKLGQRVAAQLEEAGVKLDTYGNYPGSQAAMNLLRRVAGFEGAATDGKVVAQSLQGLEQARKGLLKVKPANAEDARALGAIRRSFDDWITDAVDQKLFSGDATALDDLKQARSLWSQYRGLTKGGKDDATPIIAKMANEERTGEEVANWLLGTAGAGQAGRSARVAAEVRNAIGKDAPEWEALRQAAWTKMSNPARGEGPQAVAKSIMEFTSGQGAPLARVLFSPQELGQMQKLANVIRYTVPNPKATNPSKSGYAVARLLGAGALSGTGGAGYWWSGDPKFLAIAAAPLIRSGASLSKAVAATRAQPSGIAEGIGRAARGGLMTGAGLTGRPDEVFPATNRTP